MTIHTSDEDDFVDPFHIQLRMHTQQAAFQVSALIDSGADCNVLSYVVWDALDQSQLTNIHTNFHSFSGEETPSLGKCCIKLSIQNQPMYTTLYVVNKDQALVDVVLGRSWIRSTNCGLDWTSRQYTLHVNSTSLTSPSATALPYFQKMETTIHKQEAESNDGMVWIADTSVLDNHGWHMPTSLL